jgi:tetratricopeptide (TPR) repeat protein
LSRSPTAKECGAFDRAAACYAEIGRLLDASSGSQAETAALHHNLAGLAHARERYDEAIALFEEASRSAGGRGRRGTTRSRYTCTTSRRSTRRSANPRAEQLYREALAIKETLLGGQHPEVGLVANNLGTLLHDQNRRAEAGACYRRALEIAERAYPPTHPVTISARRNLDRLT